MRPISSTKAAIGTFQWARRKTTLGRPSLSVHKIANAAQPASSSAVGWSVAVASTWTTFASPVSLGWCPDGDYFCITKGSDFGYCQTCKKPSFFTQIKSADPEEGAWIRIFHINYCKTCKNACLISKILKITL